MDPGAYRRSLDEWLEAHAAELQKEHAGAGTLPEQVIQLNKVRRLTFDAGWMRYGWPERVGGLGGSHLLRAHLAEALSARQLVEPGLYSMAEFLVPTLIEFASPELAETAVPRALRGDETWCQGFSEPGTGSNLASLACRAVAGGGGWRVTGQKVWTSLAQFSHRCLLLARTGSVESAHRGITALLVDMDQPGITVRPIAAMHGSPEFCEVFFDDVAVPLDRTIGEVDGGWAVAMSLLPYERSTSLWQKAAFLHGRLQAVLERAPAEGLDPGRVGEVAQLLFTFRARSRATQHRFAAGERLGPETSIDKVLVAAAEQAVFDLAGEALAPAVVAGDDAESGQWRSQMLYSRAATIYGGSAEIQRNIIARQLLDLGPDR